MGNFLIVLGFLIIISAPVSVFASELLGRISTDSRANTENVISPPGAVLPTGMGAGSGAVVETVAAAIIPDRQTATQPEPLPSAPEKIVKVSGQKVYADNSLVRDERGRIYLIQGQVKKPIRTLIDLEKYSGQVIFKTTADDLSLFQTREHLDGELIRQKKEIKVYALKKGLKYHILNLAELARDYFGLPIYNLEAEEMKQYDVLTAPK